MKKLSILIILTIIHIEASTKDDFFKFKDALNNYYSNEQYLEAYVCYKFLSDSIIPELSENFKSKNEKIFQTLEIYNKNIDIHYFKSVENSLEELKSTYNKGISEYKKNHFEESKKLLTEFKELYSDNIYINTSINIKDTVFIEDKQFILHRYSSNIYSLIELLKVCYNDLANYISLCNNEILKKYQPILIKAQKLKHELDSLNKYVSNKIDEMLIISGEVININNDYIDVYGVSLPRKTYVNQSANALLGGLLSLAGDDGMQDIDKIPGVILSKKHIILYGGFIEESKINGHMSIGSEVTITGYNYIGSNQDPNGLFYYEFEKFKDSDEVIIGLDKLSNLEKEYENLISSIPMDKKFIDDYIKNSPL